MEILSQFLLRLAFGLALGMAITSPQKVSSGFFRNHLYVTLGLSTLAALVAYAGVREAFWYAVGAAVASYIGSVCWLYEKKDAGKAVLTIVAAVSLVGSHDLLTGRVDSVDYDRYLPAVQDDVTAEEVSIILDQDRRLGYLSGGLMSIQNLSSGLVLGTTLTAMFLGHWYLNSPTMELAPLRRLLLAMAAALLLQSIVSALGLACELVLGGQVTGQWLAFVVMRWSFGLFGVAVICWMAWQLLKIPNTQSATGVLYVAVIGVFVGELTAALLSSESMFPL
jgi:hypothetical protein